MPCKTYGYIRVSSTDQNASRQLVAMRERNVPENNIYLDKHSGKDFNRPQYRKLTALLQPGDLLLLVTDGVTDAFGGDDAAFLRALGGMAPRDAALAPQKFADTLLKRALDRCGGSAPDDMTVLAARVVGNG